jgi:hypothetical protein
MSQVAPGQFVGWSVDRLMEWRTGMSSLIYCLIPMVSSFQRKLESREVADITSVTGFHLSME